MKWRLSISPRHNKSGVQNYAGKDLAPVSWDYLEVIITDFLDKGVTITREDYLTLLTNLRE